MVQIMLYGGARDGEIIDVEASASNPTEPAKKFILLTRRNPVAQAFHEANLGLESSKESCKIPIVPRKAPTGPLWRADITKGW